MALPRLRVVTRKYSEMYETDGQKEVLDKETQQLLLPILKDLKYGIGENILDHGCGTGRIGSICFVPAAQKSNSKIYAVDNSDTMITHAKESYSHPCVTYLKADLLDPNFPLNDVKFDKIFSIHVMVVIQNWRGTLKKMYDLLKPGGTLTAMLVVQSCDFFDVHKHIKEDPKRETHGNALVVPDWIVDGVDPEESFRETLTSIGFKILTIATHERTHTFSSKAECIELYMAGYPTPHETHLTTPEDRHDVHATLVKFLETKNESDDSDQQKPHTVQYETLVFCAQKP